MATNSARYPVVRAFQQGKAKRDSSSLWTDGHSLYSYGMELARRTGEDTYVITARYEDCPSMTTKYHHRAMTDLLG